jgi:hypothetical protein
MDNACPVTFSVKCTFRVTRLTSIRTIGGMLGLAIYTHPQTKWAIPSGQPANVL